MQMVSCILQLARRNIPTSSMRGKDEPIALDQAIYINLAAGGIVAVVIAEEQKALDLTLASPLYAETVLGENAGTELILSKRI